MDFIGDDVYSLVLGLIYCYFDWVILYIIKICEVYCCFCFWCEIVGDDGMLLFVYLEVVLVYIVDYLVIYEVILMGGDLLVLLVCCIGVLMDWLVVILYLDIVWFYICVFVVVLGWIDVFLIWVLWLGWLVVWVVVYMNYVDELMFEVIVVLVWLVDVGIFLLL